MGCTIYQKCIIIIIIITSTYRYTHIAENCLTLAKGLAKSLVLPAHPVPMDHETFIPMSKVSKMNILANNYICKRLLAPDASFFRWKMLELPIKPISPGYKQEKPCLVLELRNSGPAHKEWESPHLHRPQMEGVLQGRSQHLQSAMLRRDGGSADQLCWPELGSNAAFLVSSHQEAAEDHGGGQSHQTGA